jgi:putative transposase
MDYKHKRRVKFLVLYHIIFVVKYRKPLLIPYGEWVKAKMLSIAGRSRFKIKNQEVDKDHIHLLVESDVALSPSQIVRRLKQETTFGINKAFSEIRKAFYSENTFWSDGYFCCSIGNVSVGAVEKYIKEQG